MLGKPLRALISICLAAVLLLAAGSPALTASADFAEGWNRMQVSKDVPEKGTVEFMSFRSFGGYEHNARVYLPYGYDPEDTETAYDVLLTLPGASGSMMTNFDTKYVYTGKQILDDLIYRGDSRPLIAVTISSFRTMGINSSDIMEEVIRDLMRTVDEKYNTVGNEKFRGRLDPNDELRNHYVLAGFCYSADLQLTVFLPRLSDLFSRFGVFSTGQYMCDEFLDDIRHANEAYPVQSIMISSGNIEFRFEYATNDFADCMESIGIPVYRFKYTAIDHGYENNAFASLYNMLQLYFAPETLSNDGESIRRELCARAQLLTAGLNEVDFSALAEEEDSAEALGEH